MDDNTIQKFLVEILRTLNEFRAENNKRWDENDKRWQENEKRWQENEKRWEENDKRWQENDKRWTENEKRLDKIESRLSKIENSRKNDICAINDIFEHFESSIIDLIDRKIDEKLEIC